MAADTNTDPRQADFDEAPEPRQVDELRVLRHASTTLTARVIGPLGFALEVQITDVQYDGVDGAALRAIALEKALKAKGLKPTGPATASHAAAPQQQAQPQQQDNSGQGPIEIAGVNGGPPRCSLHGAMKWLEGTSKSTGKEFAFYACSQRDCRPAKAKA